MKDVTDKNFGVLIAFWLLGFLLLWGLSYSSDEIATWLAKPSVKDAPTIGGFLYATLASLALGLLISAIRWLVVDSFLHHVTGPKYPDIDFAKLKDKDAFAVFQGAVENHYRYYQYYSNTLVAVIGAFGFYIYARGLPSFLTWCVVIAIGVALLLASHDCLNNYYKRVAEIAA